MGNRVSASASKRATASASARGTASANASASASVIDADTETDLSPPPPPPTTSQHFSPEAAATPHFSPGTTVRVLLGSRQWQALSGTRHHDVVEKLALIERAGLPRLKLLPATVLAELGRIPSNKEGFAVDALQAASERGVFVFFSHRWLQPEQGLPDDVDNGKATSLIEFNKWYTGRYPDRKVYFWIDYSCVPWNDRDLGIAALPIYVASCTDMLVFDSEDYHRRAWCRLECVIGFKFLFSGQVPFVLKMGFRADNALKSPQQDTWNLLDPREGQVTVPSDLLHIDELTACAQQSESWCPDKSEFKSKKKSSGLGAALRAASRAVQKHNGSAASSPHAFKMTRALDFGQTEIWPQKLSG